MAARWCWLQPFGHPETLTGNLTAKVPARRSGEAVARLVALYLAERRDGELAGPFFARSFERSVALLAPLERLQAEEATSDDFVEPCASEEYRPVVQDGECAA